VYFPLLSPLSSTKSWMPHVINKELRYSTHASFSY
jgi:hypothetical protein